MHERTHLKARIPIQSSFVTLVVAQVPTEEAAQGRKAKYMAAPNSILASVTAREYLFILADPNIRTGKRGEGGWEADSKVLGAYDRDTAQQKRPILLGFAEDSNLALLNTFFCTLISGVSYTFQKCQPWQGTSTSGLYPDKAGEPRIGPLR